MSRTRIITVRMTVTYYTLGDDPALLNHMQSNAAYLVGNKLLQSHEAVLVERPFEARTLKEAGDAAWEYRQSPQIRRDAEAAALALHLPNPTERANHELYFFSVLCVVTK